MTSTSWKSKLTAAVAAAVLAASMVPAAALGVTTLPLDDQISVGGLDAGDKAIFYRIVEQDLTTWDAENDPQHEGTPTYVGTQNWVWSKLVDKNGDGKVDGTENTNFGHKRPGPDGKLGTDDDVAENGLFIDEIIITKDPESEKEPDKPLSNLTADEKKVITVDMANAIATAIATNKGSVEYVKYDGDDHTGIVADSNGVATVSNPESGVYMVVATPGANNVDTVYKPIFVSADYHANDADGLTANLTLVGDPATPPAEATDYMPANGVKAMFKRSDLNVDKKSGVYKADGTSDDTQHDVSVGDVVDFTITTNVPTYSKDFVDAKYKLTDVITSGLVLTDANGKKDATADEIKAAITVTIENGYDALRPDKDYTITVTPTDQFVVEFLNNDPDINGDKDGFLYKPLGSPKVTITYKALVTSDAANINQMDNTVKLNFSNTLEDTEGHGELQDKTRHYTFNIDADIFGRETIPGESQDGKNTNDETRTSEVRKVVVNADGSVTETQTTKKLPGDPKTSGYDWLEGAKFELKQIQYYTTKDDGVNEVQEQVLVDTPTDKQLVKFNADHIKVKDTDTDGKNYVTSDDKGYIAMKGLDAGVYVLREIDAPLGYTFDPSISYRITITPTYALENPSSTDTGDKNQILASYTVEVEKLENGASLNPKQITTSTYTVQTGKDAAGENTPISFLNETFKTPSEYGNTTEVERTNIVKTTTTITLGEDSQTALIVNKKLGILPATGGSGIIFYLVAGGLLAGTAAILINKDRKRSIA